MTLLEIVRRIGRIFTNRYNALKKCNRSRFDDQRLDKRAVQIVEAQTKIIVDMSFNLQVAIFYASFLSFQP